jgi:type I restriction enzyme, S subunit
MKSDFIIYTLNDIAAKEKGSIISGPFGSNISSKYFQKTGVPVIRGNNLSNKSDKFIDDGFAFVSEEKADELNAYAIKNDLIFTAAGTIGQVGIIENKAKYRKYVISNKQLRVRLDLVKVNPLYAYYWFSSPWIVKDIVNKNTGSTVPLINLGIIRSLEIRIPKDRILQDKIAAVLSSLDAKIDINNRINVELESMAKTLYDYWFVQFDFPDKNGRPYKSSGGKMVWNEELKRDIPLGWKSAKMAEWIYIDNSGDWGKDEPVGNFTLRVTCLRGADINGLNGLDELKPPTRYILEKNSSKILKSHDLMIEISGGSPTQSTGRLAFITDATIKRFETPLICSNFCRPISMRNKKLLYNFVYYWNSLYDNGVFFGYEGKTTGIKNLLLDSFVNSYYTVVPEDHIVNKFYSFMENIQEKKQTALAENQKLSELRDWLLPMLMNGQVKVN